MSSLLLFILFILSTIAASLILLTAFTGLLKLTTTDRQLRQSMGEYQQLQEERWLSLDAEKRKEERNLDVSLRDFYAGSNVVRRAEGPRLSRRRWFDRPSNGVRQRQSMALNERVKQVEARTRKQEVSVALSSTG